MVRIRRRRVGRRRVVALGWWDLVGSPRSVPWQRKTKAEEVRGRFAPGETATGLTTLAPGPAAPWSLAGRDAVGRRDAAAASLRAKGMDCGAGGSLIRGKNSLPAERSCQGQHQHHKHPTPMLTNHCNHCYPVQDPSSGSSLCKIGHPASNPLPGGIQVSAAFRGLDMVVLAWKGLHSVLQIAAYTRSMSTQHLSTKKAMHGPTGLHAGWGCRIRPTCMSQ